MPKPEHIVRLKSNVGKPEDRPAFPGASVRDEVLEKQKQEAQKEKKK